MRGVAARVCIGALILAVSVLPAACGAGRALVRVSGQDITEEDLQRELLRRAGPWVLLEMIDTQLIEQAAGREGITVSEAEVRLKYEHVTARLGSEADLEAKLKLLGRTPEEFAGQVRTDCLLDRLALRDLKLTDDDIEYYYHKHLSDFSHPEQVHGRLILFTQKENATAVAEALRTPDADFAGLAKAFSEDPGTRDNGGDMGFFAREDYAAEISEAAFNLKPGETSDIIQVPDGYAIIRVEARRPAGSLPLDEVKAAIQARLELEQLDAARQTWLRKARTGAQLIIPEVELERQVRLLIALDSPFTPTNIAPEVPTAPR